MASQVYFGNATKQTWIKAPSTGFTSNSEGWSSQTTLLNGTNFIKRSRASHRKFGASWLGPMNGSSLSESLYTIKEFCDGVYGDGPFYWLDPYAVNTNVLPMHWSVPAITANDWPNLASDIVPGFTDATVNNNFPGTYVTYDTTDAYESTNKLTVIIPTGYKLHFGWHGPATGSTTGVRIVPYLRSTGLADTALNPTKITAGGTIRTNTQVSGTTYSRVEIFIATTLASEVNITGMIAQVLPTADSVASGGFLTGRGSTGLEFATSPQIEYYSANINSGQIGMSVDWVEV